MSAHIPETSTTHHQLLPLHKLTNTPDHEASSSSLSVSIDDALGNNSRKGDKHLLSKKNSNCNRLRKVFSTLRRNFSPSPTADSCATSDSSSTATNTSSLFYPARIILEKGGEDADALNAAAQHPTRIAVNVKPGPLLTKFQRSKRVARRRWSEEDNESSCSNSQETFSEVASASCSVSDLAPSLLTQESISLSSSTTTTTKTTSIMSACVPFTYNEQHQQNLQQQQQLPLQENCFLVQIESSLGAPPITSCRSTSPIPSVSSLEILFEQSSSSTLVPSSRKPLKKKRSSFFQLLGTAKKQPAKDTTDGAVVLKSTIEEHLSVTEKSVDKSTMTDPVKEFPLSDCNYPHHIDGTSSALITPRANTATSSDFLACIVSALSPYDNPHHHRRRASVLKLESVMSLASEFIQGDSNNSASTTTNTPLFSSVEDCEYSSGSETNWEEEYTVCKHVKQQLHHRKTSDLSSIYSVTSINSSTSAYSISSYINPYNCVSEGTITHSVRSDMDLNQYYFKDEDEVQVAEIAPSTRDNASFVSSKRERIAVYSPLIENPSSGVTRQPTVQMKPVLRPRRSFLKLFK